MAEPIEQTPGYFDGLWEAVVRETTASNLVAIANDRTVWTVAFLGGCVALLVAVPVILTLYANGLKRFNAHLGEALSGRVTLETTAVGFPLYPITVEGTYHGAPVVVKTVQRDTFVPMDNSEYYERRHVRITTHASYGTAFAGEQAWEIRRRGLLASRLPAEWAPYAPTAGDAGAWAIATTDQALLDHLLDAEALRLLNGLAGGLPDLVIVFRRGVFHITCAGPLRGETPAQRLLAVLAFCRAVGDRLPPAARKA